MIAVLAGALSFGAGFALQRGGICAVRAVRDVVRHGRWRRFAAFAECAAWALLALILADALGLTAHAGWPESGSLLIAGAGGVMFGLGALVNGTCAFGSAGRLAGGEASFLVLIPAFVLGALAATELGMAVSLQDLPRGELHGVALAILAVMLAAFGFWRLRTAWLSAPSLRLAAKQLAAPRWPAALSMAVIALSNVALMLIVVGWPYTTMLLDVALARGAENELRIVLALVFLSGAVTGALSAGRFRIRWASAGELTMRASGGVLMGFGAALIPGGNDALVLLGLPLLQPAAIVAYLAMVAIMTLGFTAEGMLQSRSAQRAR